jgi:hypothetical protein
MKVCWQWFRHVLFPHRNGVKPQKKIARLLTGLGRTYMRASLEFPEHPPEQRMATQGQPHGVYYLDGGHHCLIRHGGR